MERISLEDRQRFAKKYRNYFEGRVQVDLAGRMYKKVPHCFLEPDSEASYMNFNDVFIGLKGLPSNNEDELFIDVTFATGHESGHFKFSRLDAKLFAEDEIFRRVCQFGASAVGWKGRFVKDSDYDTFFKFCEDNNQKAGRGFIKSVCQRFVNAIEDGRMENMYERLYPGWGPYRVAYRGRVWLDTVVKEPDSFDALSDLYAILNGAWAMACFNIPLQGFETVYPPTSNVQIKLSEMEDFIYKAINEETSRGAATMYIHIASKIVEEIWKASQDERVVNDPIPSDEDPSGACTDGAGEASSLDEVHEAEGTGTGDGGITAGPNNSGNSEGEGSKKAPKPLFTGKGGLGSRASGSMGSVADEDVSAFREAVEEAMKAAADAMAGDMAFAQAATGSSGGSRKRVDFVDTAEEFHSDTLHEHFRAYDVAKQMPLEWEGPAKAFKRKIDALFDQKMAYSVRCQTSGRIDQAYKFAIKQIDGFCRTREENPTNIAVAIAQDNSGSMGYGENSKRWFACKATAMIEEAFKDKFPLKIIAFDASGRNLTNHEVVKNWNDRFTNSCSYNFAISGRDGWGNNDAASIRQMTDELMARPETSKLLIVLSDGCPAECSEADVTKAVKEARDKGITVIGIYFSDDYAQSDEAKDYIEMYGGFDAIATNPEGVAPELVRILKNYVSRML